MIKTYVDPYYVYSHSDDEKIGKRPINVIITASVHGNEPISSLIAYSLMDMLDTYKKLSKNIKKLIIYPFVNRTGVRFRTREERYVNNNLNDGNSSYNARETIRKIINNIPDNEDFILLDLHNSSCCEDLMIIDTQDPNCTDIEKLISSYNEDAKENKFDILKIHRDVETLKYYVNHLDRKAYNFGITVEFPGMGQCYLKCINNYLDPHAKKLYNFLNWLPNDIDELLFNTYSYKEAYNSKLLSVSNSGILKVNFTGVELNEGDTVAEIYSIDGMKLLETIKAPFYGKLANCVEVIYINEGEPIGDFINIP